MSYVYPPSEDTFLLLRNAIKFAKGKKVLEIGCGSGIILEEISKISKHCEGVDINEHAVELCKRKGLNVYKSDLFDKVKGKFDLILFNPPYLEEDPEVDKFLTEEEKMALVGGKEGIEIVDKFLKEAKNYLKKNGIILLIASSLQNFEKLKKKYREIYEFEIIDKERLFFEELYCYKITLKSHKA